MPKSTASLLLLLGALGACSFIYFFGILTHLPFIMILVFCVISIYQSIKMLRQQLPEVTQLTTDKYFIRTILLLIAFVIIADKAAHFSEKWGGWDAWSIWNLHARFLNISDFSLITHPAMTANHPDYPLMLPGIVALWSKLAGHEMYYVPFAIACLFMFLSMTLVFTEIVHKNLLAGLMVLLAFAFNDYFIIQGVQQYADTVLACFFTATMICLYHYERTQKNTFLSVACFFAVCAVWTKNEGIVFALWVVVCYLREIFRKKNLTGISVMVVAPLILICIFKLVYAAPNDLAEQKDILLGERLTNIHSYQLIWDSFCKNMSERFLGLWIAAGLYVVSIFFNKRFYNKKVVVLLLTLVSCQATYLITPYNLEWHLDTSQDRLILQVFSPFIYVFSIGIADMYNQGWFRNRRTIQTA